MRGDPLKHLFLPPTMLAAPYIDSFPDLVIQILAYLSLPDIFACLRTHTAFYKLIKGSIVLQYQITTQLAGVEDNPHSNVALHERLDRLASLEAGWTHHEFDFSKTVALPHGSWARDHPDGGIFLREHHTHRAIHYCMLLSTASGETKWLQIDVGANIVNVEVAIYEHNLIAAATTYAAASSLFLFLLLIRHRTPQGNGQRVEVVLLQFSTGTSHPQAQSPRLLVREIQAMDPQISISISGDTLALIIKQRQPSLEDHCYIFDWKTGVLIMVSPVLESRVLCSAPPPPPPQHTTAPSNSYANLLFLSPTLLLLPNTITGALEFWDPAFMHPIGALGLPRLAAGWAFSPITCGCEPGARASGTPHSPHPFHTSAEDGLAVFRISVHPTVGYSLFVHRRALLRLCPPSPRNGAGTGTFAVVPWAAWGPPVTRWIGELPSLWVSVCGERAVRSGSEIETPVVMDFHPWRVRASRGQQDGVLHKVVDEALEVLHDMAFTEPLDSMLPYVSQKLVGFEQYVGWLIDEEHLVGLKVR